MTSPGSIVVARMQMKNALSHLLSYLASAYPVQQLAPTVRIVVITHQGRVDASTARSSAPRHAVR